MLNLSYWLKHPHLIGARVKYWWWERNNQDKPWLCPGAVEYCEKHLRPDMVGLEFGSGRSTAWFASKLRKLISIEHSEPWFGKVQQALRQKHCDNVDYRLIPLDHPEPEPERPAYDPLPAYVAVLNSFADESLDLVIVDGHYRSTCIRAA